MSAYLASSKLMPVKFPSKEDTSGKALGKLLLTENLSMPDQSCNSIRIMEQCGCFSKSKNNLQQRKIFGESLPGIQNNFFVNPRFKPELIMGRLPIPIPFNGIFT